MVDYSKYNEFYDDLDFLLNTGLRGGATNPNVPALTQPTPDLVYDGVTDNYATIMSALTTKGLCVLNGVGGVAVSAPILVPAASGIVGYAADTPAAGNSTTGTYIVPTAGFNATLTPAQQAQYPTLGTTASAPVVMAGAESFLRGVKVSGKNITNSAVILAAAQISWQNVACVGGLVTTVLDNGNSPQGTWSHVTIRAAGTTTTAALDLESVDWLIDNLRCTAGSKILNAGGAKITTCHFTGASSLQTFNTQIKAPLTITNLYVDSGAATDMVNLAGGNATNPIHITGVNIANNSAATITNIFNQTSTTCPLFLNGLTTSSSTHQWTALLAGATSIDKTVGVHLAAACLTTNSLAALFPEGTPGQYEVTVY